MSFGSGYSAAVLADAPLGYWQLGEAEGYAQAVLADNPVGYWRLGDSESYAQAVVRDGAVGYWRLNGNAGDSSGNGRNGTVFGTITFGQPSAFSDGTTAARFDPAGFSFVSVPNAPSLQIVGDLTVEAWLNPASLATRQTLVTKDPANEFELTVEASSGVVNFYNQNENVFTTAGAVAGLIAIGTWAHIVVTRVVATKTITIYINGAVVKTGTYTTVVTSGTAAVAIGRSSAGIQYVNGLLDDVALYNSTLTPAQIANHYALRLSTRTATTALVATDTTPAGRHGTYVGGVTLAQASPLADGTTAAKFDKADTTRVTTPAAVVTALGTGPCTYEAWLNLDTLTAAANYAMVLTFTNNLAMHFGVFGGAGTLTRYEISVDIGGAQRQTFSPPGLAVGQWVHLVGVWNGTTLSLFVNGVFSASNPFAGAVNYGASSALWIGGYNTTGGFGFTGSIDDVAVYAYALTAQQIANHYALRLSTVGAATGYAAAVRADAATGFWRLGEAEGYAQAVLADAPTTYWRLEETSGPTAVDSAAGATRPITLPGSGIIYRVGGALANGTSGYTLNGAQPRAAIAALAIGTTATIEFWIQPVAGITAYTLVIGVSGGGSGIYVNNSTMKVNLQVGGGGAGDRFNTTALTAGTLYHVVISIAAGTGTFYINGVADGTAAGWVGLTVDSLFNVGAGGGALAATLIDEIAIYPIALSAQQAAAHYALRRSTITTVSVATVADAVAGQTGTVQPGVALGQPGPFPDGTTAALFDGATGYINVLDTPAQNPGLGSYSYELWFKRAAGVGASEFLICKANGAGNNGQGGELFINNVGVLASRLTAKTVSSSSIVNYADGQWHHAVVSMNRAIANGGQIYVDGIASGPAIDLTSEAAANLSGSSLDLLIGRRPAGNPFLGALKDVSIYNSALTAGAAAAHYARGISALVALDSSANGRTGTYAGGVTLGQAGAVPVDPAALFDSVTGEVRIGTYTLPASFSVEAFFKTTDAANQKAIFTSRETPAVPNSIHVGLNTGHPRLFIDSGTDVQVASSNVADGAYHHLVVTNNGTTTTFYVDGAQVQQTAQAHAAATSAWRIARDASGSTFFWAGTLDDVAVYSTVLTPTQVATHYAARLAGVPPGSSSSDSEEEDEIYDRLRGFYGSISGSYFVLATDTGTITLVPAVPKHTHFVQRLEVQITTPLAGAVWTLQDGAGAPIAVAPFPASAVGHYVIDLGPQGVPCTEATSLVLSISGGGSGAVGWVAWEGFKQLTLGAAA